MGMPALRHMTIPIISGLMVVFCAIPPAFSVTGCQECHGTRTPSDIRPLDAPDRDIRTGGFQGNHRSHTGSTVNVSQCDKCHQGSADYGPGHRDGQIKLSSNLNGSPLLALYKNATSSFPQSPTPSLGSCTNTNCHFEKPSPVWGGPALVYPADCNATCHSSPPSGGAGGAAGSHATHGLFFPELANCRKCHPDHTADPKFAHATSAAHRGVAVKPDDPVFGTLGNYTANRIDFLPSQTNSFSRCSNFYCHGTVQGVSDPTQPGQSIVAPTWGGRLSDSICGGRNCHGVGWAHPDDAANPKNQGRWQNLVSGSHTKHLKYRFNEIGNCLACHYNFSGNGGGCGSCHLVHSGLGYAHHIQHEIHVEFDSYITVAGTYSGDELPGTPYGSCSALYCHSDGTYVATNIMPPYPAVTWGGNATNCTSCHGYPPSYASSTPKANSHQAHSQYGCHLCHYATTTDGMTITTSRYHVNKSYNVSPYTAGGISFTYTYSASGGSCSSISCHIGGNAVWGTQLPP